MHNIDFGDCNFDIVYYIVSCCFVLCDMYFSAKFHARLLYDSIHGPTK